MHLHSFMLGMSKLKAHYSKLALGLAYLYEWSSLYPVPLEAASWHPSLCCTSPEFITLTLEAFSKG